MEKWWWTRANANAQRSYEALPANYGLGHNMMAGAFAGIAVCAALTRALMGLTTWQEHTVMYPVDLMKV